MPKNTSLTITYNTKKRRPKKGHGKPRGKKAIKHAPCCFCLSAKDIEEDLGKLIKKNGFVVHYFCLLFSSGLCQRGRTDKEGILGFLKKDIDKELARGARLRCEFCKIAGATIGCVVPACRKKFHLACGKDNGSLHQFYDTFRSYCSEHRPEQTHVPDSNSKKTSTCPICICSVPTSCSIDTLKSSCCKNPWFHRSCIQKYALSAGLHFFKCPMCNDKCRFQQEMLEFGIYIPDQDASWETEPNAFNDLLERHHVCDADICKCPSGREYDAGSGKWELLLCSNCGSEGSHVGCNGLVRMKKNREQICVECWDVVQRVETEKNSTRKVQGKSPKRPTKSPKKRVSLTNEQKKRQMLELNNRRDKTTVNISHSETDTEVDVEESQGEEDLCLAHWQQTPTEQARKRQRLSLSRSKRSSNKNNNLVSANITVTDNSNSHRVTATISQSSSRSSSNNSVTVASSNTSTSYFPNFSEYDPNEHSDSEASDSESENSDNYSINTVTDLPHRKALTISWRGKKVHITNPKTEEKHNWSLQLQMRDSNNNKSPTSSRSSSSSYTRSGQTVARSSSDDDFDDIENASPPVLIPVDEEMSVKCISPKSMNAAQPPILSPNYTIDESPRTSLVRNKYITRGTNSPISSINFGQHFVDSEDNLVIPSISAGGHINSPRSLVKPSASTNSIISVSSSDSDTAESQNTRKVRNKYLTKTNSQVSDGSVVDLTEGDLPSTIRLIPRYFGRAPIKPPLMEPEVVILD